MIALSLFLFVPVLIALYWCFDQIKELKTQLKAKENNDTAVDIGRIWTSLQEMQEEINMLKIKSVKVDDRLLNAEKNIEEIDEILKDTVSQADLEIEKALFSEQKNAISSELKKFLGQKKPQARKPRVKKDQLAQSKKLPAS